MRKLIILSLILLLTSCKVNVNMTSDTQQGTTTEDTVTRHQIGSYNDFYLVVFDDFIYFGKDEDSFKRVYDHNSTSSLCETTKSSSYFYGWCNVTINENFFNFHYYRNELVILNTEDGLIYKPTGEVIYLSNGTFKDIDTTNLGEILAYDHSGTKFILKDQNVNFSYYNTSTKQSIELPQLSNRQNDNIEVIPLNENFSKFLGASSGIITLFDINDLENKTILTFAEYIDYTNGILTYKNLNNYKIYEYHIDTNTQEEVDVFDYRYTYVSYNQYLVHEKDEDIYIYDKNKKEYIAHFDYRGSYAPIILQKDTLFIPTPSTIIVYSLSTNEIVKEIQGDYRIYKSYFNENKVVLLSDSKIIWYDLNGEMVENDLDATLLNEPPIITDDFIYFPYLNTIVYKNSSTNEQLPDPLITNAHTTYLLGPNKLFVYLSDGQTYIVYNDHIEKLDWLSDYIENDLN